MVAKKNRNSDDANIKFSLGKETATQPIKKEGERNGDENLNWLGILKEVLRNPFTSPLEDALYRSRWNAAASRRQCAAQFRNNHRTIYKTFVAADIVANFFYMVIAMSFLTRGVDLHPITTTISGLEAFINFGAQYIK